MLHKFFKTAMLLSLSLLPFLASCKKEAKPSESGPKVTLISIDKKEAEITMFDELHLEATAHPVAQNFKINWKSEDESIATVNAEGVVKGVNLGTVKIIASVAGSDKTAECKVTICLAHLSIRIGENLTLSVDKTHQLTLSFSPEKPINGVNVNWGSDNMDVATVDSDGKITTKRTGEAKIWVEIVEPFFEKSRAECNLIVGHYYPDYGFGIKIGNYVWAPVNCGYEPARGSYKGYTLGKYYQWGRRGGHGAGDILNNLFDATAPETVKGPVTYEFSYHNPDLFITTKKGDIDLIIEGGGERWNNGDEDEPEKTENDPCPKGWRVPTAKELKNLSKFFVDEVSIDSEEYCKFVDKKRGNELLMPYTRKLSQINGRAWSGTSYFTYWSSLIVGANDIVVLYKRPAINLITTSEPLVGGGYPIRCVQE